MDSCPILRERHAPRSVPGRAGERLELRIAAALEVFLDGCRAR